MKIFFWMHLISGCVGQCETVFFICLVEYTAHSTLYVPLFSGVTRGEQSFANERRLKAISQEISHVVLFAVFLCYFILLLFRHCVSGKLLPFFTQTADLLILIMLIFLSDVVVYGLV